MLEAGTIAVMTPVRETDFGYFLSDGEEDVLLYRSEITEEFDPESEHTVFLYQDHEGRLAATLTIPEIRQGTYGWAEVVEVKKNLGVFIHIGLKKDILVSLDDLPALFHLWPEEGDRLYCTLKTDSKNRLFGKLGTEEVMRELAVPADRKAFNQNVRGTVYRLLLSGSFMMTEEGFLGFVHESERHQEPRLGQKVEGRIIDVKDDGTINVSLLPRKYERLEEDAEKIYSYLTQRGGSMPYWDKSLPEEIASRFDMSKASFKRALGQLMKKGLIVQRDGWTYTKEESVKNDGR